MSLAQVVYNISTDSDFAKQLRLDPEAALSAKGYKLSKEEVAFLASGLKHNDNTKVRLSDVAMVGSSWKG
jgi:hypothetical protein